MTHYEIIKNNLIRIRENIAIAAQKSGRRGEDITLVCVTKTINSERIGVLREVLLSVPRESSPFPVIFGENRVQELLDKYDFFNGKQTHLQNTSDHKDDDVIWHLIGHLQTNKVKYITGKVFLIHSVNSVRLLEEINLRAAKMRLCQDILLEVNIAEEASKQGMAKNEVFPIIARVRELQNVRFRGLMCMAPFYEDKENTRGTFRALRILADEIRETMPDMNMDYLSMGMSNDYMVAIEEGANMVRLGTCIFQGTT